jgi:hypothetical protein
LGVGKRAFYFTFISFLVLSLFIIMFSTSQVADTKTQKSDRAKVEVANEFTKDMTSVFLPRILEISSRAAIRTMIDHMYDDEEAVDDVDLRMQELLIDGKYNTWPQPQMTNRTLTYWTDNITRLADEYFRINSTVIFSDFRVTQTEPWSVDVTVRADVFTNLSDTIYVTGKDIYANISIIGMWDPMAARYAKSYPTPMNRTIKQSLAANWSDSSFLEHIQTGTYNWHDSAPSFLGRLTDSAVMSPCCGIESVLNNSWPDALLSYVDYHYFHATYTCFNADPTLSGIYQPNFLLAFRGSYDEVKLDNIHILYYGYKDIATRTQICT